MAVDMPGEQVEHTISRFGLHKLHVLGTVKLDVAGWVQAVTSKGADVSTLEVMDFKDEIGFYHLYLWWKDLTPGVSYAK